MATDVKLKLAVEGGQVVSQTIDGVTKRLEAMGGTAGIAKNMLSGMAAGLSVAAFTAYAKAAVDAADAINDLSQRVGISVRELSKYELAAAQSGTTMEALAKGIKGIAVNLAEHGDALRKAGISATTADGAMQQLADVFAAMPDGMEKTTLAVKLFGKSGMDLIPMLNLGSAGLQDAAEKSAAYAEQMALLAPLADALNDNLAALATSSKTVGMAMINPFMPALVAITGQMAEAATQTGVFEAAIVGVGGALRVGWGHEIEILMLKTRAWLNELEAKKLRFFGRDDEAGAYMNAANNDYNAIKNLYANDPLKPKPAAPVDTSAIDGALEKYKALLAALKDNNSAASDAKKLAKERADAENKAIEEATKTAQGLANIRNKEAEDIDAYMREESKRLADSARASEDAVRAAQDEYDNHGKLKSEIAQTTLARLQDQLVNKTAGTEAYESLERQISAQKRLIAIMQNTEVRDAAEQGAKDLADANKKAAEESSKYWEDALMRAFESGKGFFESLWDTIKNTLKTQVLKVAVSGVLGGVSGLVNAATGTSAGTSLLGTGASLANGASALSGTSIASAVTSGVSAFWGGLTASGATASGAAAAGVAYAGAEAAGAGGAYLAGSSTTSALAAIPVYGWIAAAVVAAWAYAAKQGETRSGGQYAYNTITAASGRVSGPSGGEIAGTSAVIDAGVGGINSILKQAGSTLYVTGFQAGIETSANGRGGVFAGGTLSSGASFGESGQGSNYAGTLYDKSYGFELNQGEAQKYLAQDLGAATIEALQAATDLPTAIAAMVKGFETQVINPTQETIAAKGAEITALLNDVTAVVTGVNAFRESLKALPFRELEGMSFNAASSLLAVSAGARQAGETMDQYLGRGLQNLQANLSGFYDNFYNESEKTANLTRNVTDALAAQNITLPKVDTNLRAWYRSEVERLGAMDLSIAANAQAYASVLALQSSVAQLATGADAAAQQIAEAAARLQADIYSAQDDAMSAYMSAQADYAAIVAQEQESAAQAMQQAADASAQAADAIRSAMASAGQGIVALIRDLTTTAGGTLDPMALMRSTQRAYLDDLRLAQGGDVEASGRVAASARAYLDANNAVSAGSRQAATVAQVVAELGRLPAVKTYEQQLLEAVQGTTTAVTTSSASNASTIAAALNAKITAELTMDARSEILKIMNLVVNDENLTTEQKTLALAESNQIDKLIKLSSSNLFSSVDQQLALATTGIVAKTFTAALGAHDIDAMSIAYAQSTTIEKIIRASGGVLTLDQQMLLNGIEKYNKDIQIGVKIDSSELSTFQQTLMSIFGTIDITGLAAAGVDLSGVISNEALARLQSVSTYVQSFDWANTDLPTRASQLHAVRTTAIAYGVSSQDVATAIGTTKSELASWYAYLNVPFFAAGGMHAGGLRIVGENGPELEVTGPSRIYNAADTMAMLRNPQTNSAALADGLKAMAAELAAVRAELAAIKANTQAGAVHQADSADSLRKLKNNGVQVWTDPAEPLTTQAAP